MSRKLEGLLLSAGSGGGFSALQVLLLGDNELQSWASVDALNTFPRLQDVRLTGNPFLGVDPSHGRSQVRTLRVKCT